MSKKKKNKTEHAINLVLPKNLVKELRKMRIKKNPVKIILAYYAVFIAIAFALKWLSGLSIPCLIIMLAAEFFVVPLCVRCSYKRAYEDNRFFEVGQYIEQMLYSFKNTKKVLKSMEDIYPIFACSEIGDAMAAAISDIKNLGLKPALDNFEAKYDCEKIRQLNKFMYEVETMGGEHGSTLDLLLQDRTAWVERTVLFQKEKNNKKITCIASIIISLLLAIALEKMLPSDMANIAGNVISQAATVVVFVLDLIIYYIVEKKCSTPMLQTFKLLDDDLAKKYYEYIANYDAKTEFVKNLKGLLIPLALLVLGVAINSVYTMAASGVMAILILLRHKTAYRSRLKAIKTEIEIQFPRWLMQMALLTQSNSVQVALYKSIQNAPTILKPELIKLNNALSDDPTSVAPYLNFMKEFNMPEITSSIKMFYAISVGAGDNVEQQVADIIKRNNAMVDKSEKMAFDNALGGMFILFLLPQVTGSIKLLADMVLFFAAFMGTAASTI